MRVYVTNVLITVRSFLRLARCSLVAAQKSTGVDLYSDVRFHALYQG